ncbi:VTCN1 inhibitor, partial [Rhynochetos jubatus]|nr:VTCN1 inhibitor [Rhynochetos jubatus]
GQPATTCHAFLGETVVLPCTATSPGELILSSSILYWQRMTSVVHFVYNGQDLLLHQDERYHGRTSLFLDQMQHGNFSLMLSNVQVNDSGLYTCIYKQTGDYLSPTQKSEIELNVSGKILLSSETGRQSQISSRSSADAPQLVTLPLSFHLLVTLGVWHL